MSTWKDNFLPDEWVAASRSGADMWRSVRRTTNFCIKHLIGALLPFCVGFGVGYFIVPSIDSEHVTALVRGVLSVAGILSGFVITLMLFTGRVESTKGLAVEQAKDYAGKVTYLLWSQAMTLLAHITTALLSLVWLGVHGLKGAECWIPTASALVIGALAISVVRTLLLPLQIYELHKFSLDAMIAEKERELEESIAKLYKDEE